MRDYHQSAGYVRVRPRGHLGGKTSASLNIMEVWTFLSSVPRRLDNRYRGHDACPSLRQEVQPATQWPLHEDQNCFPKVRH